MCVVVTYIALIVGDVGRRCGSSSHCCGSLGGVLGRYSGLLVIWRPTILQILLIYHSRWESRILLYFHLVGQNSWHSVCRSVRRLAGISRRGSGVRLEPSEMHDSDASWAGSRNGVAKGTTSLRHSAFHVHADPNSWIIMILWSKYGDHRGYSQTRPVGPNSQAVKNCGRCVRVTRIWILKPEYLG